MPASPPLNPTLRKWLPILLLAVLPLIPLWRAVFLNQAIGPFDQIRTMAPWNAPKPEQPWDVLQADSILQFLPWRQLVLESWGKGQLPLWNPYELAGTPLLANSQSAGFYPPHILLGLLKIPAIPAIKILAWFHLFLAGGGVYWLTRKLGGARPGALFAGATFTLSPFMVDWTPLASVIETVAWIPWLLGSVLSIFAATERKTSDLLVIALSTGMMLLAGHLQFAAYGLIATGLLSICLVALSAGRLRIALPGLLIAGIAGALMALPQIAPVLNYSQFSHRKNAPTEGGYDGYVATAIKPFEFANMAYPLSLGDPRVPVQVGHDVSIAAYWPPLVKRGANFAESAVTIGPLALALLFFVPWKKKGVVAMAVVGVLFLLLAAGTQLNMLLYFFVPGWSATGSPGRAVCIFLLIASTFAGLGFSNLLQSKPGKRTLLLAGAGVALGWLFALDLSQMAPAAVGIDPETVKQFEHQAFSSGLVPLSIGLGGLSMACIYFLCRAKNRVLCWALALLAPVVLFVASDGLDLIMTGEPLTPIAKPADQRYAFLNENWDILTAVHANMPPNLASLFHIHELGGYDSLLHRDTVAMLHQVDGQDPAPQANGNIMFVKPSADAKQLAEAGVSELDGPEGRTVDVPGDGRFSFHGGPVHVDEEGSDRLDLTVSGSGTLVVKDRMMPGWTATVDNQPVDLQPGLWRKVDVKGSGQHLVRFRYWPPGLSQGLMLGLVGWAIFLVALASTVRQSAKRV